MSRRSKATSPGRPKDPEKREAILDAAKRLFAERGFEGTSMDAVAQAASVSKLTVYSHFGDKDNLFKSAVEARCDEQMPATLFRQPRDLPLRDALRGIARSFHRLVHSDEAISLHRMMIANAGQDPHLAELFFEAGPRRTLEAFEGFLRDQISRGALEIEQPARAAAHFFCLVKGIGHMQQLCGCSRPVPRNEFDAHIDSVIDLFLRAYAVRPSAP